MERTYGTIGSVSSGTMRSVDLLDTFADELEHLARANDESDKWSDLVADARNAADAMRREDEDTLSGFSDDDADESELVSELFDALDEYAAPYCHFGAHEGDGACYGYWPDIDVMERDARDDDDIVKVSDMSEVPDGWTGYVMLVNDHGNVTLYAPRVEWQEVWSVV